VIAVIKGEAERFDPETRQALIEVVNHVSIILTVRRSELATLATEKRHRVSVTTGYSTL